MANPNSPFGFRPVIRQGGAPFSVREYGKTAADPNPIYAFDLVGHISGTSTPLPEAPQQFTLSRVQSGTQLTPGTSLWLGAGMAYGLAGVAAVIPVCDEIDVIFIAQCNGTTQIQNASVANLNANVVASAGNALTKMSQMQVNSGSIAATAGLDLRIIRVAQLSSNNEGPNAIVEVLISKHAFTPGAAGS